MVQSTGTHPSGAAKNPYAAVWAEAQSTVRALIAEVHQLGVQLDAVSRNLNWQGGAERHFRAQAARQHSYLHRNNDALRFVLAKMMEAERLAPVTAPNPGRAA